MTNAENAASAELGDERNEKYGENPIPLSDFSDEVKRKESHKGDKRKRKSLNYIYKQVAYFRQLCKRPQNHEPVVASDGQKIREPCGYAYDG